MASFAAAERAATVFSSSCLLAFASWAWRVVRARASRRPLQNQATDTPAKREQIMSAQFVAYPRCKLWRGEMKNQFDSKRPSNSARTVGKKSTHRAAAIVATRKKRYGELSWRRVSASHRAKYAIATIAIAAPYRRSVDR